MLSGAAGLSSVLPLSIQKALAINPAKGSTWQDAEHVVILMQENRSFDHCFGTLKGVRGYNDPRAIDLPNGNPVWLQTDGRGDTYAPFHLDIKNTKATWMSSLPHSWTNQVDARNDGKFDKWLVEKQSGSKAYKDMPLTLGYHTRQDLPFNYALADAFTVCDQHFCSSLTGTTPNRLFLWTGTIRKDQNEDSQANVWNEDADFETLNWTTFPERLEEAGISWKCYQNELYVNVGFEGEQESWLSNFGDNPLEYFEQYHVKLHSKHLEYLKQKHALLPAQIAEAEKKLAALPPGDAHIDHLQLQLKQMRKDMEDIKKDIHLTEAGTFDKLTDREKNIHKKAFDTNSKDANYHELTTLKYTDNDVAREVQVPKGDVLYQFREDVKTGKLPTVSWITAPENFSDHPSAPWYGAWYVSEVMDILTHNPEVWKKTIFILTYDENDGYFDHVPPFVAPHSHKPGTGKVSGGIDTRAEFVTMDQEKKRKQWDAKYYRENAIGLGYRVPMIIASPWSRGGWVNSEVFDHTSSLQFLEKFINLKTGKNVKESNISNWRRTVCGDLTSAFRQYNGEQIPTPVFLDMDAYVEGIHKAKFKGLPAFKKLTDADVKTIKHKPRTSPVMAQQEKGIKHACALPYELYVDGGFNKAKHAVELTFKAGNKLFGKKTAGGAFNVYAPGKYASLQTPGTMEDVRTWSYAVTPGDTVKDEWPLADFENGKYHLRVYGPNGFYREFKGDAKDPQINIDFAYQTLNNAANGNVALTFSIPGNHAPLTVEVTDNAYKTAAKQMTIHYESFAPQIMKIDLAKSFGWYDFSVKVKGYPDLTARYAGRVETGKSSFSDPLMGGVV